MATVLPHGVLFRGAAEEAIRTYLIEKENALDAVIGLPANIFYGTSIPTCIMVLKKGRQQRDVLFIDASAHFEKAKNQNQLRPSDIDRIISTYRNRTSQEKYSHLASIEEIRENDYNLNIPRYVDTFEAEEQVDLTAVARELKALDADMAKLDAQIRDYCAQLGIESPF
jgi:type I restriction enzyme M protein